MYGRVLTEVTKFIFSPLKSQTCALLPAERVIISVPVQSPATLTFKRVEGGKYMLLLCGGRKDTTKRVLFDRVKAAESGGVFYQEEMALVEGDI